MKPSDLVAVAAIDRASLAFENAPTRELPLHQAGGTHAQCGDERDAPALPERGRGATASLAEPELPAGSLSVTNWPSLFRIALVAFFVSAATSCARNYEQAYFSPQGSGYLIELKGTRNRLAHDPVSLIFGNSYEETHEIEIPRLDGTIDGNEIPRFNYSGSIVISENKMNVALTYGNTGEKGRYQLSWNGTYVLSPKVEPSKQEIAAVRTRMLRGDKSEAVIAARKLMDMGRDGRRTVYEELLNNPTVGNNIADSFSTMYISRPEKIERWVTEDLPDLEKLAQSDDQEIMWVGMSFLSCTDEGRKKLQEIGRQDPGKQRFVDWYLER